MPLSTSLDGIGDRGVVQIEVWKDFAGRALNKGAAEWVCPPGAEDAAGPWVGVVGADGVINGRFDNVASDAELTATVEAAMTYMSVLSQGHLDELGPDQRSAA